MSDFNGIDELALPSGKWLYANCGIIGIAKNGDRLELYEGYDGILEIGGLSASDRIYIADRVIALWQEYRESLQTQDQSEGGEQ